MLCPCIIAHQKTPFQPLYQDLQLRRILFPDRVAHSVEYEKYTIHKAFFILLRVKDYQYIRILAIKKKESSRIFKKTQKVGEKGQETFTIYFCHQNFGTKMSNPLSEVLTLIKKDLHIYTFYVVHYC